MTPVTLEPGPGFGVGRGFAIRGPFPVQAPDKAPETCTWSTRSADRGSQVSALGVGLPSGTPFRCRHRIKRRKRAPGQRGLRADLWPQLFSDVNCIALWISSEKTLTRLYSVLHWFHKRLEVNVKNPRENRCFQTIIVFSFGSVDNSQKCTVLWKIAAKLITVGTSVNNEMWVKLSGQRGLRVGATCKAATTTETRSLGSTEDALDMRISCFVMVSNVRWGNAIAY